MVGTILLVFVSLVAACAGLVSLSNSTAGVGGVTTACLFAIFARMAQSGVQHKRLMEQLEPGRVDALRRSVSGASV
jgi:hypothetical protein